jgi:uncharacterized delta-60 repeat protein
MLLSLSDVASSLFGRQHHASRKARRSGRAALRRPTFRPRVEPLEDRLCLSVISSDGTLDPSFNGTGKVTTDFSLANDNAYSVALQPDGKIVVAGDSDDGRNFALARYNADGSLDASFGGTGTVTTDFGWAYSWARSVALQADGKIVAAGSTGDGSNYKFAVARYNADGSLDTSFDGDGKVTTSFGDRGLANGVAVGADGKIVAAGTSGPWWRSSVAAARYNADGSLDTTFNGTGQVITVFSSGEGDGRSVAVQADGKIVIAGDSNSFGAGHPHNFGLIRYNANGSLDTSFNGTGMVTTNFGALDTALSVAVQADGKIVAGGYSWAYGPSDFAVARYNADGSLDTSFDGDGKVTTDFGSSDWGASVALQADGKIVVVGGTTVSAGPASFALARYNADGSLDTSFGGTGKVTTEFVAFPYSGAYSVALQADGKIVAAGYTSDGISNNFAVARYGTPAIPVGLEIEPGNATYTGSTFLESNIASILTPGTAEGVITYSFFSDAGGANVIPAPTNAGTYYVQGHFASSDITLWTNADSLIAGFTIAKADAAISVTPYSMTYDGAAHTATGTSTGVESPIPADLSSLLDLSGTAHTHAGTYLDTWTFAGNDNYNAASGTVTDVITQASLTGFATTQDALNIAKQGYMNINMSGITGFVGPDTIASVFGSMTFQLTIGANVYTFQPTVTVVSSTEVHLAYTLRGGTAAGDALRHDLALIDLDATSASNAQYETLRISGQNQDYSFVDDFFTRLFSSMK